MFICLCVHALACAFSSLVLLTSNTSNHNYTLSIKRNGGIVIYPPLLAHDWEVWTLECCPQVGIYVLQIEYKWHFSKEKKNCNSLVEEDKAYSSTLWLQEDPCSLLTFKRYLYKILFMYESQNIAKYMNSSTLTSLWLCWNNIILSYQIHIYFTNLSAKLDNNIHFWRVVLLSYMTKPR